MSSADSAGNISRHRKLGELTGNIRTFALPFEEQPYTFKMQYTYDSYNRMQSMTYPDGEVVSYGYNRGGMLNSIVGVKNGVPYKYLDSIRYNRFELRDTVFYGNGAWTEYAYDTLQRLKTLKSHTSSGAGTGELMQDIVYEYDHVGNITEISNTAGRLANGLGNRFYSHYTYDDLYRLTGSDGWWDGEDLAYQTQMSYLPNGRIERKYTDALVLTQTGTSNTLQAVHYDNRYHYNFSQPNTLSHIDTGSDQEFQWDAKGNMTKQINHTGNRNRYLCWDEQNRLLGVVDEKHLSYYQYDANGERTLKLTGEPVVQNVSGQRQYIYPLTHPTLYASPYIVCNDKGYTKHYYAESERIASRIGGGGLSMLDKAVETEWLSTQLDSSSRMCESVLECLGAAGVPKDSPMENLYDWRDSVQPEKDCYWYHPDHLGSSSWITYTDGSAVQHLHYLPWGEDLVDQRLNSFDGVRYTFSAKERDAETGLSYFGARYYSSDLSIWLSVDPMSDKYPSLSPYVYCADNPVRLVDPNGEEVYIIGDDVAAALEQLQNQTTLVLSLDEHGKLCYSGEAKSDIDKMIVDAINDEDISVNIISTTSNIVHSENGGAYGGNSYENGSVCTDQYVCPSMLAAFDESVGDSKPGLTMVHELAESYYGGALALEYGQGSAFGQGDWSTYSEAHWCANQVAIGNRGPVVMRTSLRYNTKYNPSFPISPFNFPIEVGDFEIQTGWTRTTNKYGL